MHYWRLKPTSSLADVLDTLRSRRDWWTITEICEDTGRTRRSVGGVVKTIRVNDLAVIRKRPGATKGDLQLQISDQGLIWLWAMEHNLPPRLLSFFMGLLDILAQTGPTFTRTLIIGKDSKATKTRNSFKELEALGHVRIKRSATEAHVIEITGPGLALLGSWKRIQNGDLRL